MATVQEIYKKIKGSQEPFKVVAEFLAAKSDNKAQKVSQKAAKSDNKAQKVSQKAANSETPKK
jgi:hypothetical protein